MTEARETQPFLSDELQRRDLPPAAHSRQESDEEEEDDEDEDDGDDSEDEDEDDEAGSDGYSE